MNCGRRSRRSSRHWKCSFVESATPRRIARRCRPALADARIDAEARRCPHAAGCTAEIGPLLGEIPTNCRRVAWRMCRDLAGLAEQKGVILSHSVEEPIRFRSLTRDAGNGRSWDCWRMPSTAIDAGGTVELLAGNRKERSRDCDSKTPAPGIARASPRLFEPFYRASKSPMSPGHMGLGAVLSENSY